MVEQPSVEPYAPAQTRIELPKSTPFVTYSLLGLTILIYIAQVLSENLLGTDLPAYFGMKINEFIVAGQLWRLITPMLLHSSPLHIGFNMYALVVIGSGLERFFGHGRYLLLYLMGAFAGNVLSFLLSANPSLGASTAIFGLLAAEGVFLYRHRQIFGEKSRAALQNVITVAAINFLIGLQPGIDNWGHLGGLLGGLIFAWVGGPKLEIEGAPPFIRLRDEHGSAQVITAVAIILLIFGALTAYGMGLFGSF
jgi:rhomboid protease GluP